jgi:hypothetical protein
MLHSENITVLADNGVQIFIASDIEAVLSMAYDCDYYSGRRCYRYTESEVCEYFGISLSELDRMKYTLSYDFCHKNGSYKFHNN